MRSHLCNNVWTALAAVLLATAGLTSSSAEDSSELKMMGSLSCSSVACHGSQPDQTSLPRSHGEFLRWMQADPHAPSALTLSSEKYQAILVRVSQREDRSVDRLVQARCAKCHDPLGKTGDYTSHSLVGHGIGCESCHGNAEKWLTRHYEQDVERTELLSLGMIDTKNLHTRGRQCASCHVGSAAQDMNHDMIAAGHPPLRFELSAYHDLIPHKHWNDTRERLEKRDFQVQLWAAGQVTSAAARVELLAARCGTHSGNWPEFAEYNCFSCHRQVGNSTSLRASDGLPGRPSWSRWNVMFVDGPPLKSLRELFRNDFSPEQMEVRRASAAVKQMPPVIFGEAELTNKQLLQNLASSLSNETETDWETRCQQYLALVAAERSYRDELAKLQFVARLDEAEYNRRLAAQRSMLADLTLVRGWLQFESGSSKSVLRDEPLQFDEHRAEIGPHLKQIADQLHGRVLKLK
jgi:hypothetical protein